MTTPTNGGVEVASAPGMELSEVALVMRLRQGDAAIVEGLYRRYQPIVFSVARYLLGDAESAADVSQEVWLRLWLRREEVPPDVRLRPWLRRMTRNASLDLLRQRQRHRWVTWEPERAEQQGTSRADESPEEAVLRLAARRAILISLAQLPPRQRQLLLLAVVVGHSRSQIGARLGLGPSGVKSLLARARHAFRQHYQRALAVDDGSRLTRRSAVPAGR